MTKNLSTTALTKLFDCLVAEFASRANTGVTFSDLTAIGHELESRGVDILPKGGGSISCVLKTAEGECDE